MHNERVEDCSLGDSTSDSFENLLERGIMEKSIYVIFGEGGIHAIKHIFSQKASTNHMKSFLVTRNSVTMKDLVFRYGVI